MRFTKSLRNPWTTLIVIYDILVIANIVGLFCFVDTLIKERAVHFIEFYLIIIIHLVFFFYIYRDYKSAPKKYASKKKASKKNNEVYRRKMPRLIDRIYCQITGQPYKLLQGNYHSRYLQDFDTVQCLGEGGFGVVFEAKSKIDKCSYAIKRIPFLYDDELKADKILREVQALAKLKHENIIGYNNSWIEKPPIGWIEEHDKNYINDTTNTEGYSTYKTKTRKEKSNLRKKSTKKEESPRFIDEANKDDSFIVFDSASQTKTARKNVNKKICPRKLNVFLYISMDLCKESLKEWLSKNREERNLEFCLNIFVQILKAVEYIHSEGLMHRDLKPANIFFVNDKQINVGDFGLAKEFGDSPIETMTGNSKDNTTQVGTKLYMSPELKNGNYDCKVDVYSLGIIFFELLVPFTTETERITILSLIRNEEFPPNFTNKFLKEYKILKKMLCKDPKKRLTAKEILSRSPFKKISKAIIKN